MFGLGKLVSGLTGGLLDKIGLGFLKPFVSIAVDLFTGDYASLIGDVTGLVAKFTGMDFLENLSKLNPLGAFGGGSGDFLGNLLSGEGLSSLKNLAHSFGFTGADKLFNIVEDFNNATSLLSQNRSAAHFGNMLG